MNKTSLFGFHVAAIAVLLGISRVDADDPTFVQLNLLAPKIVDASPAFPGGQYGAENLLDSTADRVTEYASHSRGLQTFVDFDLGQPVPVAAFRHVQRNGPDTVAEADLIFSNEPDFKQVVGRERVKHEDRPAGKTFAAFAPITARFVRWQVIAMRPGTSPNVGGGSIAFYRAGDTERAPSHIGIEARAVSVVQRRGEQQVQPLKVTLDYPYAVAAEVVLHVKGLESKPIRLGFGSQTVEFTMPALESDGSLEVGIQYNQQTVARREVLLHAPRKTTIYILPHSHTDIGYTEIQTEIEDKQVKNLLLGMQYARQTADYPPGARFVWNVEVLWAADLYLRRLDESQRDEFLDAVKKGQVALCGMYLNELTGLCRPEELMRLFRMATQLRERTGATIDSAMISDVPGYTWGTVTAMAQAGIKYFSVAPNYFDRIGDILVQWENKPFYWLGPNETDKVLVWIPYKGYAMSHVFGHLSAGFVEQYQNQLEQTGYPYDIAYMRWAGHGDNAVPDPNICDFVKDWNASHDWPRFIISGTGEAFQAFEKQYGDQLPRVRGDWTPYWEDGAGSSALETATNRASSDRLAQAEALWAMMGPNSYPAGDFENAWRDVLLYSEHTWGAWCSISEPNRKETREQWSIKQSYAVAADLQSRHLLSRAQSLGQGDDSSSAVDVFNTTSWTRSDLVIVPKYLSEQRNRVLDQSGQPVPSQRLRSGELVFFAREVLPFAARRFTLEVGESFVDGTVTTQDRVIDNGLLQVRLDECGNVAELHAQGIEGNLVDPSAGHAANEYLYLIGDNVADLQRTGPAKITVKETGPLVTSLLAESAAPGCFKLQREIRLVAGQDYVEIINLVDKQRLIATSYSAKEGKESVNFAFPFNVPNGQMRLEVPFGVIRPEVDQIPSACKNWFTVSRWADVANEDYGVTWVTLDAPLVQVGGITATLLNSQTNPDVWRKKVEPTQKLYSWAMNNHWGTNYRAYQEGPVVFRFILRPHRSSSLADAARLAIGLSQPLLATDVKGEQPASASLIQLDNDDVLVTGLKPSDDGKAWIVRLYGAAGKATSTTLKWSQPGPKKVWLSDLSEQPQQELSGAVSVPAWGVVTLRAER